MTPDDLVERVARAICAADGNDWTDTAEAGKMLYRHEARAAIAIVLEEALAVTRDCMSAQMAYALIGALMEKKDG